MTKINGRKAGCVVFLLLLTYLTARAQTFKTVLPFDGSNGADPYIVPVQGRNGDAYGTTYYGGESGCDDAYGFGCGVVYKITPKGVITVLYNFNWYNLPNGIFPGALVLASDGNLYGTTNWGGTNNSIFCY